MSIFLKVAMLLDGKQALTHKTDAVVVYILNDDGGMDCL